MSSSLQNWLCLTALPHIFSTVSLYNVECILQSPPRISSEYDRGYHFPEKHPMQKSAKLCTHCLGPHSFSDSPQGLPWPSATWAEPAPWAACLLLPANQQHQGNSTHSYITCAYPMMQQDLYPTQTYLQVIQVTDLCGYQTSALLAFHILLPYTPNMTISSMLSPSAPTALKSQLIILNTFFSLIKDLLNTHPPTHPDGCK